MNNDELRHPTDDEMLDFIEEYAYSIVDQLDDFRPGGLPPTREQEIEALRRCVEDMISDYPELGTLTPPQ
jgi:hypothetical protein